MFFFLGKFDFFYKSKKADKKDFTKGCRLSEVNRKGKVVSYLVFGILKGTNSSLRERIINFFTTALTPWCWYITL